MCYAHALLGRPPVNMYRSSIPLGSPRIKVVKATRLGELRGANDTKPLSSQLALVLALTLMFVPWPKPTIVVLESHVLIDDDKLPRRWLGY